MGNAETRASATNVNNLIKYFVHLFSQEKMHSSTQVHREALQRQTQQDWANREYIELIGGSIKRIADFLNSFDMSCRSRLSTLNVKLTSLERKVDFLEAKVSRDGETPT